MFPSGGSSYGRSDQGNCGPRGVGVEVAAVAIIGFGALEAFLRICDLSHLAGHRGTWSDRGHSDLPQLLPREDLEKYTEPGSEPENK
jgi:hypothetical protein